MKLLNVEIEKGEGRFPSHCLSVADESFENQITHLCPKSFLIMAVTASTCHKMDIHLFAYPFTC